MDFFQLSILYIPVNILHEQADKQNKEYTAYFILKLQFQLQKMQLQKRTEKDFGQILRFKEEITMSMTGTVSTTSTTSMSEGYKSYSTSRPDRAGKEQQASGNTAKQVSEGTTKRSATGKTIGEPKLSKEGASYYEELKKKYSGMDFILVSTDQKEQAKAQAAKYATPGKMVVLIDEEKIERMATDEKYRRQYEAIIAGASNQLSTIGQQAAATGAKVRTYGMQVNDNGTASYFAVLEKANEAQRQRIERRAEQKKADRKEADRKEADRKKADRMDAERRSEKLTEKTAEKKADHEAAQRSDLDEDTIMISAGSIEELMQKIQDVQMAARSDTVQTEEEKKLGRHIDFAL